MQKTASVAWNLKRYGIIGWLSWMSRAASYRAWLILTQEGRREARFDELNGTDTSGYFSKEDLGLPSDSIHYAPIKPRVFQEAMGRLSLDTSKFTFIDIGCGKGRALVLAAKMGFRKVIGVERSSYLAEIARQNSESADYQVQNCDATAFEFPDEDSVVFLFNPFWWPTMDRFVENLRASLATHPRKVYVVYVNPFCRQSFDGAARKITGIKNHYAIYEMPAPPKQENLSVTTIIGT